jgi:hypothetical protein
LYFEIYLLAHHPQKSTITSLYQYQSNKKIFKQPPCQRLAEENRQPPFKKKCYWRMLECFQQDDDSSDENILGDDLDMAF